MSDQTVKVKIKIESAGGNIPENIRKALEGVNAEVTAVTQNTKKMSEVFFHMNQVVEGIGNIANAFSSINKTVSEYTSAFMAQSEAETKPAQVMRNTIDARDEEIASIKELASAQQALGITGDEVQLAGAQELATYMEKTESLRISEHKTSSAFNPVILFPALKFRS